MLKDSMADIKSRYTTINVYPDDRDKAREMKRGGESWSEFLRRAAEALEAIEEDQ